MKKIIFTFLVSSLISGISFGQKDYGSELDATVAIPTGANSKYFNVGYGVTGGFYYTLESDWRLGLTLGFIRIGVDGKEINNYFQTLGQQGNIDLKGSVSIIPILFSGKYIFPAASGTYAVIEGGLYTFWSKVNGNIIYSGTNPGTVSIDESEFSSEPGFALGMGSLFRVNQEISIDVSIKYNFVRNSGAIKINDRTGEKSFGSSHFFNIAIGANWNFDL